MMNTTNILIINSLELMIYSVILNSITVLYLEIKFLYIIMLLKFLF